MMASFVIEVDPRELRVPSLSCQGADPAKLHRQISKFGVSQVGMPLIWAYQSADDVFVITNGVTRATRMAKLSPGTLVQIEVIGRLNRDCAFLPRIGDLLP